MLLNYHIGRLVLSSLCVGDLVRLILCGVRFAGLNLQSRRSHVVDFRHVNLCGSRNLGKINGDNFLAHSSTFRC